jgi:hypothetical protein
VALIHNEKDVATIAGLLKLYLRSLEPPLFPVELFEKVMQVTDAFAQTNNIEVWEKVKNELEEKEFCVE